MRIEPDIYVLLAALEKRGHTSFAVGGCVRDSLLGMEPHDWDIATSALPEQVLDALNQPAPTDRAGLRYGVVTVSTGVREVQVTTFRREIGYSDHRRPDRVEFTPSVDLERRDFTVNAMAADKEGIVTDPFNGKADLERRLIRCVGDPFRRFEEDALRILRALRFAAVLDFSLEEQTKTALLAKADTLRHLTKTVIKREIDKLRAGTGAERILREFEGVLKEL